jgi:hypothetical protein
MVVVILEMVVTGTKDIETRLEKGEVGERGGLQCSGSRWRWTIGIRRSMQGHRPPGTCRLAPLFMDSWDVVESTFPSLGEFDI